ncbi:long-chain-fatty-acid--CoA ligase [Gymnodinialimonas sp.]
MSDAIMVDEPIAEATNTATDKPDYPWLNKYPPGIDFFDEIPVRATWELLDDTLAQHGNRPALDFMDKKYDWNDVGELINKFATGLQSMGVGPGTRVGIFLPNCPYFVVAYHAILCVGGTVVNLNPLYAPRELKHKLEDSGTEILITMDLEELYRKCAMMLDKCEDLRKIITCPMADILPVTKKLLFSVARRKDVAKVPTDDQHETWTKLIDNNGKYDRPSIDLESHPAVFQYTGGTTGVPKAAVLTHRNLTANAEQAVRWFSDADHGNERFLAVLPFFHVFAMTGIMNLAMRMGAEIILHPRFVLEDVMKTIDNKKVTFFPAVPTIYTAINNYKKRDKYDLSSIKYCVSGGAPLPAEVQQTFEKLTGCVLAEGYGLSETTPVACVNPIVGQKKPGSIGLPVPGTIVEIVDLEDKSKVVKQGDKGEITIRGPQVMQGYWNRPDETAEAMQHGRFHTGDVAYMDDEGYIFIVDRIKDMIIAGGYNIYPRNVEEAIYQHESVEECVVGGVNDAYRGETVKAWIKLHDGHELDAPGLKKFLEDKLSAIEMPKLVEFRDEPLPKTMIGKMDRKTLVDAENKIQAEKKAAKEAEAATKADEDD